ncbi:MAG: fibronectin type III domain-containing protein [Bacteroidota bacterium]
MKRLIRFMILALAMLGVSKGSFAQTTTCLPPTAPLATNIGVSSAILSWTPSNTVSQYYTVQYRPLGTASWLTVTVQQIPYTLGNLQCGTSYEWQVQAYCINPNGVASPSGYGAPANFSTLVCTSTCNPPTGIAATNITTNAATISWGAVTGASGYNVRYRIAGSTAWMTTSSTNNSINLSNLTCGSTYEVALQTICSNTSTSIFSAPITIATQACTINCVPPTGVSVSGITTNVAVFNWTPMAGGSFLYDIGYRIVGTTNQITIVNVTPPFTIANLTCNTNYEVRVRTNCGNNNYSAWSAFVPFTTLACPTSCPTPSALSSSNLTASSAVLSWTSASPNPVNYNLRYRVSSASSYITINNVTSPYQLGSLTCGSSYEWQVQTICANAAGTATLSPWSPSAYFTTTACPAPCPAPSGLTATNLTTNSATLSWTVVAGAPNYTVRRRAVGTSTWSYLNTTTTSVLVGNLACGVTYEWQVRANCTTGSNTNVNPYTASATFTTLACPTTCPAPIQLSTTNITGSSAQLNWASTSVPQYRVRYRVNVTGSAWTYVVTASINTVLSGLANSTQYVWQVQSICSNTSTTINAPWSLQSYFTTLSANISCPPPAVLNFQPGSTPGSLSVSWPAVSGAVSYTVRYRLANTTTWTQSGTTNTYLLPITNLTSGAAYEFQIRSVCATSNGAAITGAWSPSYFYTTPLLLSVYPNPADGAVTVEWVAEVDGIVKVSIHDIFGQGKRSMDWIAVAGLNRLEFAVSELHEGWYSVSLATEHKIQTVRLLVNRP